MMCLEGAVRWRKVSLCDLVRDVICETYVVGVQDIMRLDNSARMNLPGSTVNNWTWRIGNPDIWEKLAPEAAALRELAEIYDRLPPEIAEAAAPEEAS